MKISRLIKREQFEAMSERPGLISNSLELEGQVFVSTSKNAPSLARDRLLLLEFFWERKRRKRESKDVMRTV